MSIYTGLEDTIRLLRARNDNLHTQNDELSNRIELDLNPRIERMQGKIDTLSRVCTTLNVDCRSYNKELAELKETLVLQLSVNTDLLNDNDGLEDTISVLKGALKAYEKEHELGQSNRRRLKRIAELAGRAL